MSHILVVDDDICIGNLLQEALESEGYRVSRAYSGTEAVLALERGRPDLILLDLMLPGLSGEAVLPKLAGVPVIVVSAKADVDSKAALLLEGAADYVAKPFALRELLARVAVRLREAPRPGGKPPRLRPPAAGAGRPLGLHRRRGGAPHQDGIRHFKTAHGKPRPGGHQIPAAGRDWPGHP